jgi:hypothetical protein
MHKQNSGVRSKELEGSPASLEVDDELAREINDLIDFSELRQGLEDVHVSE